MWRPTNSPDDYIITVRHDRHWQVLAVETVIFTESCSLYLSFVVVRDFLHLGSTLSRPPLFFSPFFSPPPRFFSSSSCSLLLPSPLHLPSSFLLSPPLLSLLISLSPFFAFILSSPFIFPLFISPPFHSPFFILPFFSPPFVFIYIFFLFFFVFFLLTA